MDDKQREELLKSFIEEIDFMDNYKYKIYFHVADHPVIYVPEMHKKHIRKLNKILKKNLMDHIKVVVEDVVRKQF